MRIRLTDGQGTPLFRLEVCCKLLDRRQLIQRGVLVMLSGHANIHCRPRYGFNRFDRNWMVLIFGSHRQRLRQARTRSRRSNPATIMYGTRGEASRKLTRCEPL